MTLFWALSAAVAVVALGLLLRPLLGRGAGGAAVSGRELNIAVYRDQLRELESDLRAGTLAQADFERSRLELEQRLAHDVPPEPGRAPAQRRGAGPRLMALPALAVPLFGLAIYLAIGTPEALDPRLREARSIGEAEIEAMVGRLAERLEKDPEDLEGWKMLGKSYSVMQRFAEAANAYAKAAARAPRDPQLLADLADALAMARGQSMRGEPEELVLRALQIDPDNMKALALAGTAAFDREDYAGAAGFWSRMLAHVPADSEDARTIQANVREARQLAEAKAGAPAAAAGPGLRGTVRLSPKLAARAAPEDTVFIFARAAEGPPMPLAVLRKAVRDLPVAFALDDSLAMTPAMKLSGHPRVVVGARISKSGSATPQPGDLEGFSAVVPNTARGVNVVIGLEVSAKK